MSCPSDRSPAKAPSALTHACSRPCTALILNRCRFMSASRWMFSSKRRRCAVPKRRGVRSIKSIWEGQDMVDFRIVTKCRHLISIAEATFAAGCKVGPNYKRPDSAVPANFVEATTQPATQPATTQYTAKPATQPIGDLAHWWATFNDPMLDDLTARALQS